MRLNIPSRVILRYIESTNKPFVPALGPESFPTPRPARTSRGTSSMRTALVRVLVLAIGAAVSAASAHAQPATSNAPTLPGAPRLGGHVQAPQTAADQIRLTATLNPCRCPFA